jgi:predicted transcriptional regulator
MQDKKEDFQVFQLKFEDVRPPVIKENKSNGYVIYGEKNDYPNYLLDMFSRSAKHGAIVRGKVDYILGNGFAFQDDADTQTVKGTIVEVANASGETLEDVSSKLVMDIELFGGGYLEVLYNKQGKPSEIYHLDFSKVRVSKDLKTFYFSENWTKEYCGKITQNNNPEFIEIPAFDKSKPKGKQILFVREYTPNMGVYPTPGYNASLRYIQVDISISEYHLNGISNGMFASKMINFNNGIPEDGEKGKIEKKVNDKFAGAKNAGKMMISFNKSAENAPTVLDLSGTELDKHFDLLNKTVQQEVFSGHRVTSPMLFGIKTEGQLGGRTELREAFELFERTYINGKRKLVEKNLNAVLSLNGLKPVYIQRSEPIGYGLSESDISAVLTEDEKRERLGLKPKAQTQQAPAKFSDGLDDERDIKVFAEFGKKKDEYEIIKSRKVLYKDNLEFYKDYFAAVAELTEDAKSVLDLIKKDKRVTPVTIAEVLNMNMAGARAIIEDLVSAGLLKKGTVKTASGDEESVHELTPKGSDAISGGGTDKPETTSIKIMYAYEGVKDNRNRPFCAKMLDLNRLYTRQEIESISSRLGYSVWDRRGGWYKPAGATEARPYCRHFWTVNTVTTKK